MATDLSTLDGLGEELPLLAPGMISQTHGDLRVILDI